MAAIFDTTRSASVEATMWFAKPDVDATALSKGMRSTRDEVLVVKQWDTDASRPLAVPTSRPGVATRMSIEARTVAFFNDVPAERLLAID